MLSAPSLEERTLVSLYAFKKNHPSHHKCATVRSRQPAHSLPTLSVRCHCLSHWLINCHVEMQIALQSVLPWLQSQPLSCLSGHKWQTHWEATAETASFHRAGNFSAPKISQLFLHSQGPLPNITFHSQRMKRNRSTTHQTRAVLEIFFFFLSIFPWKSHSSSLG